MEKFDDLNPQFSMNLGNHKKTIYISFILLGLITVFWKYLSFQFLFLFEDIGNDTLTLFYPNLLEDVRTIRQEGIPLWSFSKGIGQGNYSENILLPFTWLYVLLGEKYLAFGIGWVQFLKVVIIAICSFKLFRIQGLSDQASILGCSLLTFLGYVIVGSAWYGHSTNAMFILILLLGIEYWIAQRKWWLIPIAIVFLLGPSLVFAIEFLVIYFVLRLSLSNNLNFQSVKGLALNSWKPILVGSLLVAPFLGFEIYKFLYSPRLGGQASYSDILSSVGVFSTNTAEHYATIISRFFSNDLIGTGDLFSGWGNYLEAPLFYCGIGTIMLAPQLFKFLTRKQKIAFGSILGLWLIMLIFPYFRYAFYFFVGDYYKSALSLFIPFTLVWMAVLTFDRLIKGGKLNFVLLALSALLMLIFIFSVTGISRNVIINESNRILVLAFLVLEFAALVCHRLTKHKNLMLALFVGLMISEGAILSYPALNNRRALDKTTFTSRSYYNDYSVEALQYLKSIDKDFFRVEKTYGSFLSGLNDSQAQGFFDTKTYRSHNHKNYIKFFLAMDMMNPGDEHSTRWINGLAIAPEVHPFIQLKYMITKPGSTGDLPNNNYESLGELNGLTLYKNKFPISFGFPVESYITESEFANFDTYYQKLAALYKTAIIPDVESTLYPQLERKDPNTISSALSLNSIGRKFKDKCLKISSFKQSHIKGTIRVDKASMVIFSFPYDIGWSALVNAKKSKLSYVDNGFTGLYLEPGAYNIELKYHPPFLGFGIALFCIGLILYIFFLIKFKPEKPLLSEMKFAEVQTPPTAPVVQKQEAINGGQKTKPKKKKKK